MKTQIIARLLAALLLTIPATTSFANFFGSDDFNDNNKDLAKWGTDSGGVGHVLNEINQRLEYMSDGSNAYLDRPWILNTGSYVANWEAQLDVHVSAATLLNDGDDRRFTLSLSAGLFAAGVQLELENYNGTVIRSFTVSDEGPGGSDIIAATASIDGAVRMNFDASTKILAFHYDADGGIGGYNWTQFYAIDTDAVGTNWNLNASSTFALALTGESDGVPVGAGEVWGDNFSAVPEPSSAGLLLMGALAFCRRKRAA